MLFMVHPPILGIVFLLLLCVAGIWGLLLIDAVRKKDKGKKRLFAILFVVTLIPPLFFFIYMQYIFHVL